MYSHLACWLGVMLVMVIAAPLRLRAWESSRRWARAEQPSASCTNLHTHYNTVLQLKSISLTCSLLGSQSTGEQDIEQPQPSPALLLSLHRKPHPLYLLSAPHMHVHCSEHTLHLVHQVLHTPFPHPTTFIDHHYTTTSVCSLTVLASS